ncbi:DNA-directed RNA polymerase [Delftia acidovorans]
MTYSQLCQRERETEVLAVEAAVKRYREIMDQATRARAGSSLYPGQQLMLRWITPLVDRLRLEQMEVRNHVPAEDRHIYGPFLLQLPAEKLAVITMHSVLSTLLSVSRNLQDEMAVSGASRAWGGLGGDGYGVGGATGEGSLDGAGVVPELALPGTFSLPGPMVGPVGGGPGGSHLGGCEAPVLELVVKISEAVRAEINLSRLEDTHRREWERAKQQQRAQDRTISVPFVNRQALMSLGRPDEWTRPAMCKLGAVLLRFMHEVAVVADPELGECAALQFYQEARGPGLPPGPAYVALHDSVLRFVDLTHMTREIWPPRYLPMLVAPLGWRSPSRGGYLCLDVHLTRTKGLARQRAVLSEHPLDTIYAGLDCLARTAWRMNPHVLPVMREAWHRHGGGLAALPARRNLALPARPASDPADPEGSAARDRAYLREFRRVQRHNRNTHALRCDFELKLQVMDQFEADVFYFPHNLDFRGRAYPIPPHLNHMGSDICRGVLMFGEGRALGPHGLRWLKIHLANLYGQDKLSFDDRLGFVDAHWPEIVASARAPLVGVGDDDSRSHWWLEGEEPWQVLAACCELAAATGELGQRGRVPGIVADAEASRFVSYLPIHQDGSCNGLQHYAALGRDALGARWVDVLPSSKPQDVYTVVMSHVAEAVGRSARLFARAGEDGEDGVGTGAARLAVRCIQAALDPSGPQAQELCAQAAVGQPCEDSAAAAVAAAVQAPGASDVLPDICAWVVDGHITRKVIKQTVITSVYGVTQIGARQQIQARLRDVLGVQQAALERLASREQAELRAQLAAWSHFRAAVRTYELRYRKWRRCRSPATPEDAPGVLTTETARAGYAERFHEGGAAQLGAGEPVLEWDGPVPPLPRLGSLPLLHEDDMYSCARYLATLTLRSLGRVFQGARDTMAWLSECAGRIAQAGMDVEWVTPLGLPVVQPYRLRRAHQLRTVVQTLTLAEVDDQPVSARCQRTGFPPNYVHSIDGTHMLLSAMAMARLGLTFAAVHDSFWTHAAHIPAMARTLREQFYDLHSQPLLAQLLESFRAQYPAVDFPDIPPSGSLSLDVVLESPYFFD